MGVQKYGAENIGCVEVMMVDWFIYNRDNPGGGVDGAGKNAPQVECHAFDRFPLSTSLVTLLKLYSYAMKMEMGKGFDSVPTMQLGVFFIARKYHFRGVFCSFFSGTKVLHAVE